MWVAEKHDQAQPPLYPALSFIHISGSGVSGAKLFSCTIFRMVYLDYMGEVEVVFEKYRSVQFTNTGGKSCDYMFSLTTHRCGTDCITDFFQPVAISSSRGSGSGFPSASPSNLVR